MTLFFLAAGLGTRLRPITDRRAKPAVPLLNIPLMHWCAAFISSSLQGGVEERIVVEEQDNQDGDSAAKKSMDRPIVETIIVNTHHRPESLASPIEGLRNVFPNAARNIHVSHEPDEPLGAGGALVHARRWLDNAHGTVSPHGDLVLVANSDEFLIDLSSSLRLSSGAGGGEERSGALYQLVQRHKKSGAAATLLVMDHPDAGLSMGAAWVMSDVAPIVEKAHHADRVFQVLGFGRDRNQWPSGAKPKHYVGIALINWKKVSKYLPSNGPSCLLYDGLTEAIAHGERVEAFCCELRWNETGSVHQLAEASRMALQAAAPQSVGTPEFSFVSRVLSQLHPGDYRFWQSSDGATALVSCEGSTPSERDRFFESLKHRTQKNVSQSFFVIGGPADTAAPTEYTPIQRALSWLKSERAQSQTHSVNTSESVSKAHWDSTVQSVDPLVAPDLLTSSVCVWM